MSQPKEYSSLPLAIVIAAVILLSAVGGWFLLGQDASARIDDDDDAAFLPSGTFTSDPVIADPLIDIDAELRKARLAADAGFVVSPPEQNALYFYGRVLRADPGHPLANAEMGAVLARASLIVDNHLAAGNFDAAYSVASRVAERQPEHEFVDSMRDALSDYAGSLVAQAQRYAQGGNDAEAAKALAQLEQLPGLSTAYVAVSRDSVVEIQQARSTAEQKLLEDMRLAEEKAVSDWARKVRDSIEAGRLIMPKGDNARDYLMERETPAATKTQLTSELLAALMTASEQSLESGALADVEAYLQVANDLGIDEADDFSNVESNDSTNTLDVNGNSLATMRDSVESKLITAEGNKVLGLASFVRLKTAPARYPSRANNRDITGFVDVEFTVTTSGETANIEVLTAQPENVFEKSVIEAVQQWTFQPREYRGQAINQRTAARLVFELE